MPKFSNYRPNCVKAVNCLNGSCCFHIQQKNIHMKSNVSILAIQNVAKRATGLELQGVFFNWASPDFAKCWNHIHFARHLDVFRSKGGQSGTLTFF